MIGPLEIAILLVIVFVILLMGGHKYLPTLGRSAGKGAKTGGEKAKQLASTVGEKASEIDTEKIAKSAGDGIREAKEVRGALIGNDTPKDSSEEAGAEAASHEHSSSSTPPVPERQPPDLEKQEPPSRS